MATRRKPVIKIVEARPMTEVNFRSNDGPIKEMSKTSLNIAPPKPARPPSQIKPNTSLSLSKGKKFYDSFEALNAKKENNLIKPPIPAARKSVLSTSSANTANTTKSNDEDKPNGYQSETVNANDTPKQHRSVKITQSGSTDELHMPGIESDSISFSEARSRFGGNWFGNKELAVSATNLKQKGKATIIRPKSTFLNKTFTLDSLENKSKTAESNVQNLSNIIDAGDSGLNMKPCLPQKPTIIKPKPLSKSMIFMDTREHSHKENNAKINLDLKSIINYEPYNLINIETKDGSEADSIPSNSMGNIDLAGLDFVTVLTDQDLLTKNYNNSSDVCIPPLIGSDEISVRNLNKFEEFPETKSADRPPRPTVGPKIHDPQNLTSNTPEPQGPRALALYDYESGHAEDLNFKAGEIIMLDGTVDGKWLKGHKFLSDELGMFPSNFVQIIEPLSNKPSNTEASNDLMTSEKPRCVAKYDFEGLQENGELSFREGDIIFLNKRINDEWLEGQLDATRSRGIFPISFVEMIHDLPEDANDSEMKAVKIIEKSFKKVVAMYDFHGGQTGDLDFVAGDTIEVVGEINSDWLEGRIAERCGIFPSSFVTDQ